MQHGPKQTCHLQQRSTNPEYKSTQQDLTRIKTEKTQECRLRDSRYGFSISQSSFVKKLFNKILVFQHLNFIRTIYESAMIRNEIMNFISNSFSNPAQVLVINYDDE